MSSYAEDMHFNDAVKHVKRIGKGSIVDLQRQFKIGYNRAIGILNEMESIGVVEKHVNGRGRIVADSNATENQIAELQRKLKELNTGRFKGLFAIKFKSDDYTQKNILDSIDVLNNLLNMPSAKTT